MAIRNILFNFNVDQNTPIDSRLVVATLDARDAVPLGVRYDGLLTYVVEDSMNYQLQGGTANSNWVNQGTAALTTEQLASLALADTALQPGDVVVNNIHVGDFVAPLAQAFVVGAFNLNTDHIQVDDINGDSFADSVVVGEKMRVELLDGTFADFTIVLLNTAFSGSTLVTFTGELPNNINSGAAITVNQSIVTELDNSATVTVAVDDAGKTTFNVVGGGLEANPTTDVLPKRAADGTFVDSQIRENEIGSGDDAVTHVQMGTVENPTQLNLKGQLFLNTGLAGNLGNVPFVPLGEVAQSVYTFEVDGDGGITHGATTTSSLGRTTFISSQAEADAISHSATDGQFITVQGGSYGVSFFTQLRYPADNGQTELGTIDGVVYEDDDVYLVGRAGLGLGLGTDPVFSQGDSNYNIQINHPDSSGTDTTIGRYNLLADGELFNLNDAGVQLAVRQTPTLVDGDGETIARPWIQAGITQSSSGNGHEGRINVSRGTFADAAFGTELAPVILVGACLGIIRDVTLTEGHTFVWSDEFGRFIEVSPQLRTVAELPGGPGGQTSTPFYEDDVLVQNGDIVFLQGDATATFGKTIVPTGLWRYRLISQLIQGWVALGKSDQYNNNIIYGPGENIFNEVDDTETPFRATIYTNDWAPDPAIPGTGGVFQSDEVVGFTGLEGNADITYWRWTFEGASTGGDATLEPPLDPPVDVPGGVNNWVSTFRPFHFGVEPGVASNWENYWTRLNPYVGELLEEVEDGIRVQQTGGREQVDLFNEPATGNPVTPTSWRLTLNEGETDAANIATLPELIASSKWGTAPTGTRPNPLTWAGLTTTGGPTFIPADNAVAIKTAYEGNADTNAFTDGDEVIVDGWGTPPTGTKPNDLSWKELTHTLVHDDVIGEISGGGELGADFTHPAATNSLTLLVTLLNEDERDISREQFFLPGIRAVGPTSGSFGDARVIDRVQNQGSNALLLTFETGITVGPSDGNDSTLTVYIVEQEFISKIEGGTYDNGVLVIPEASTGVIDAVIVSSPVTTSIQIQAGGQFVFLGNLYQADKDQGILTITSESTAESLLAASAIGPLGGTGGGIDYSANANFTGDLQHNGVDVPVAGFDSAAEALFQRVDSFGTFQTPALLPTPITGYDSTTNLVLGGVGYYIHYLNTAGSTSATLTTAADTNTIIFQFNIN